MMDFINGIRDWPLEVWLLPNTWFIVGIAVSMVVLPIYAVIAHVMLPDRIKQRTEVPYVIVAAVIIGLIVL